MAVIDDRALADSEKIDPAEVLVIGHGRTEIKAGVEMGAVTIRRLPRDAKRPRELHKDLGTNYILEDYTDPQPRCLIRPEQSHEI